MATEAAAGSWVRREDGERKVTGRAIYSGDLHPGGLLHLRLVTSPFAHARINRIDCEAARLVPGVVGVYTADDLPIVPTEDLTRSRDPLARERVFFNGHPVAIVAAETEAAAEDAVDRVDVEYEELEALVDPLQALEEEDIHVHEAEKLGVRDDAGAHTSVSEHTQPLPRPANATTAQRFARGNVERGLAEADAVVERTYRTSWVHQSYLEPQSCTAIPEADGSLTIYASTQGAFFARSEVAKALGIPLSRVKAITSEVGGAFGAKYSLIDPLVAAVALKTGRPAQLVYTRSEDFLAACPAPGVVVEVRSGAKRDGSLTALQARVVVDTGAYPGGTAEIVSLLLGGTYRFPNLQIDAYEVLTNKPGSGAYRAPGAPQACFAIEGQMDLLARELDLDPMEFRLQNVVVEGDEMPGGDTWPVLGGQQVLERLRERAGWINRSEKQPDEGVGIALGGWPSGTQPASAVCKLNTDGTLTIVVGSSDISGTKTGFQLLAADVFGLSPEQVNIETTDTGAAPFAGAAGGSKITFTVGGAVLRAAQDALQQVLDIAGEEIEVSPEDLEMANGGVQVKGVPSTHTSLADIASKSTAFGGKYGPILGHGRNAPPIAAPGFAAHLARVKVDRETGLVRVLDYVAVQDVGRAINPAGIDDQVRGGIAQGIGWALMEQLVYDEAGTLRTGSFVDYGFPAAPDVPQITSILVEVPYPDGPLGARGVGEPPVVAGAAAIANAVLDATGVRPTDLPMTPERLFRLFSDGDEQERH